LLLGTVKYTKIVVFLEKIYSQKYRRFIASHWEIEPPVGCLPRNNP